MQTTGIDNSLKRWQLREHRDKGVVQWTYPTWKINLNSRRLTCMIHDNIEKFKVAAPITCQ